MKSNIKNSIFIISTAILFNACSYKNIETYQNNDNNLNCNQITTKIADLIDENSKINETTGLEDKSIFTWIIWPVFGTYNQFKASNSRDSVDSRYERLINLKYNQGCELTDKERYFMNNKGRLSDKLPQVK
ncbi:MAG: hypothetical protein U9Q30_09380 [Campylobacterota bacterium]|nr:hypothetical protein [Campylobacterota bacterium]